MADDVIVEFKAEVAKFKKDLDAVKKGLKGVQSGADDATEKAEDMGKKLSGKIGSQIKTFGATLIGAFAVQAVVRSAVQSITTFEKSIASLSAITGATGDDLDFLKNKAIELGAASGLGASETAKAFELIGSAKPELLKSGEALASVTAEAILLSQASGLDLVSSANAVTTALNQFGLGAEEAGRSVNVLAAGAKEGASAIPATAEALAQFGAVASGANITLEQSVGLVQVLAEKQITASVAGNNLKNIILKLQTAGKGFSTGQFVLNEALEQTKDELKAIDDPVKRATAETKLFGLESITSAKILLANTGGLVTYTEAVTGTSVAIEQAAVNQSTLSFKTEQLSATYEAFVLSLEDGTGAFGEFAKSVVETATEVLNLLTGIEKTKSELSDSEKSIRDNAETVLTLVKALSVLTAGIAGFAVGTKIATAISAAHAAITKIITASTKGATIAQRAYNAAIAANPLGLIIALLATAGAAFLAYSDSVDDAADSENKLADAAAKLRRELSLQEQKLDRITQVAIKLALIGDKPLFEFTSGDLEKQRDLFIVIFEKAERARRAAEAGGRSLTENQKGQLDLAARSIEQLNIELKARKDALDALRDTKAAGDDLIKIKQAELKIIKETPAATEAEIAARRRKADVLDAEIKTLQELGKAEDIKNAKVTEGFKDFDAEQKALDDLRKLSIDTVLNNEKIAFAEKKSLLDQERELIIRNSQLGPAQKAVELAKIQQLEDDARSASVAKGKADRDERDETEDNRIQSRNDATLSAAETLASSLIDIQTTQNDRVAEAAIIALENRLDKGLISEEEFATARGKILTDQAEKAKSIAITESIINTAVAVTKALASAPPPANFILAGAVGIAGGIQTGLIATEPIPQFGDGGWIGGRPHSGGGTDINAEKDEFMVRKSEARKHGDLLEKLNKGALDSYIQQRYVVPALLKAEANRGHKRDERLSNSLTVAMGGNSLSDGNLLASDKQTRRVLQTIEAAIRDTQQPDQRYHY